MKLLKLELEPTLLLISSYDNTTKKLISGLLSEELTLGTKRKIQKIHKAVLLAYNELLEDAKEVKKTCEEDEEKYLTEVKILLSEEVEINAEPFLISTIENISTSANYNFDLIEKIAV
jgi:hypothetical protein